MAADNCALCHFLFGKYRPRADFPPLPTVSFLRKFYRIQAKTTKPAVLYFAGCRQSAQKQAAAFMRLYKKQKHS